MISVIVGNLHQYIYLLYSSSDMIAVAISTNRAKERAEPQYAPIQNSSLRYKEPPPRIPGDRHQPIFICYNKKLYIQGVPLATEPGISLIILTPIKIMQRNRQTLQTHTLQTHTTNTRTTDTHTTHTLQTH
jgi:hypothetical protein